MEWWKDKKYLVSELENEEWGIKEVVGRETDSGWEYAIISWTHGSCSLVMTFKNGKVTI
jgi:hypothetical protein